MDNPEVIQPQMMYAYNTHRNIPWNDVEYQPPSKYEDPLKQVLQRKYKEDPASIPRSSHLTRRGFYMDYHVKVVKALPAPDAHPPADPWDQTENKKKSKLNKLDKSLSKRTYLDDIQNEEKRRSKPAPGAYNLCKTQDELQKEKSELKTKKRYQGQKHFFYQDTQFLSDRNPGMGSHNPHEDVSHTRPNKTTHKFWIEKHKKQSDKFKKRLSVQPAPGTHTPIPLGYSTFARIMTADGTMRKNSTQKSEKKRIFHGFGSDSKFEYTRPSKKKIVEKRPSPGDHEMVLEWKGKKMDLRGHNWIRARSVGRSRSVYN